MVEATSGPAPRGIVVNASRYVLDDDQRMAAERHLGWSITPDDNRHRPMQVNAGEPLDVVVSKSADSFDLTPEEWSGAELAIIPPGFATPAAVFLAEIHGRRGHFPLMLRRKPPPIGVFGILNLSAIRLAGRARTEGDADAPQAAVLRDVEPYIVLSELVRRSGRSQNDWENMAHNRIGTPGSPRWEDGGEGFSRPTLQRWLRGERGGPDHRQGLRLASICAAWGLFRGYTTGRLAGIDMTAERLQEVFSDWRVREDTAASESPLVINASHKLNRNDIERLKSLQGWTGPVDARDWGRPMFDDGDTLADEIHGRLDREQQTRAQWDGRKLAVCVPELPSACAVFIADLHGRRGSFPPVLWRPPVQQGGDTVYPVADVVNLRAIRDAAGERTAAG